MIPHALGLGVLLPAVVAAAVAAGLSRIPSARAGAAAALAVAVGYAAGHLGVLGWHGAWPVDVTQRVPHVALLAGLLALASLGTPSLERRLAPLLAALVAAPVLIGPLAGAGTGIVVAAIAALAVHAGLWAGAVREQPPLGTAALLIVAAATLAGASAASGSLIVGQLGGVVAACAGAVAILSRIPRLEMGLEPMAATAALTMGSLAILAGAYSSTPPGALALWGLMPAAVWGARRATRGLGRKWLSVGVQVLAALIIGGAAAGWATVATAPDAGGDTEGSGDYDYGYGYQ